jgi:hypothetical protein
VTDQRRPNDPWHYEPSSGVPQFKKCHYLASFVFHLHTHLHRFRSRTFGCSGRTNRASQQSATEQAWTGRLLGALPLHHQPFARQEFLCLSLGSQMIGQR